MTHMSLLKAIEEGRFAEVKRLLAEGADVNQKYSSGKLHGCTPLLLACQNNQTLIGLMLVKTASLDVNEQDSKGQTALMLAAKYDNELVVEKLLSRPDLEVNAQRFDPKNPSHPENGRTALHFAAVCSSAKCVELLLNHPNIMLNLRDNSKRKAKDLARSFHVLYFFSNHEKRNSSRDKAPTLS